MVGTTITGQNTGKFLPKKWQNLVKINKNTHVLENFIKNSKKKMNYCTFFVKKC